MKFEKIAHNAHRKLVLQRTAKSFILQCHTDSYQENLSKKMILHVQTKVQYNNSVSEVLLNEK